MSRPSAPLLAGLAALLALVAVGLLLGLGDEAHEADSAAPEPLSERAETPTHSAALRGAAPPPPPEAVVDTEPAPASHAFEIQTIDAVSEAPIEGVDVIAEEGGLVGATDATGRLQWSGPEPTLRIRTSLQAYTPERATLRPGEPRILRLHAGVSVRGRVVRSNPTPLPVPDATIRVYDVDRAMYLGTALRSDAVGAFRVPAIRPGFPFDLVVTAADSVPVVRRFHLLRGPDIVVDLGVGTSIEGHLVAADGTRIARGGIPVMLVRAGHDLPGERGELRRKLVADNADLARVGQSTALRPHHLPTSDRFRVLTVTTNDEGAFRMDHVPSGLRMQVVAVLDEQTRVRSEALYFEEPQGSPEPVILRVPGRGALKLQVKDPWLPRTTACSVSLRGVHHTMSLSAEPDPEGWRTYANLPVGSYHLSVRQRNGRTVERSVQIEAGRTSEQVVLLHCVETARGHVVDDLGLPVPGARIQWEPNSAGEHDTIVRVVADHAGSFEIQGIRGPAHRVVISPPAEFAPASRVVRLELGRVESGPEPVTYTLASRPAIDGRVFGPDPITRMTVTITTQNYSGVHEVRVKQDGSFSMPGVPEPAGVAVVRVRGMAPAIVRFDPKQAPAETAFDRVFVEASRVATVRVFAGGKRLPGARVRLLPPLQGTWRADRRGEVRIAGLHPGPTRVEVSAPGSLIPPRTTTLSPTAAGSVQSLLLAAEHGRVRGRVPFDASGHVGHLHGQMWFLTPAGGRVRGKPPTYVLRPQVDGSLETLVPAGRYSLLLPRGKRRSFRVRAGEVTDLGLLTR